MTQYIYVPLKKVVTKYEVKEFLRRLRFQITLLWNNLRKPLHQISLLSLLFHLEVHCRMLIKILNETHVSKENTVNQIEKMSNCIFESNTITFNDDELPTKEDVCNRGLHLTLKC